jgi:hypothetical protein
MTGEDLAADARDDEGDEGVGEGGEAEGVTVVEVVEESEGPGPEDALELGAEEGEFDDENDEEVGRGVKECDAWSDGGLEGKHEQEKECGHQPSQAKAPERG